MAKKAKKAMKKAKKKVAKKQVARAAPRLTARMHTMAFSQLVAHAHRFQLSPVCYRVFPDGSAQVCKLLPDGTYGDCKRYDVRPVPGPRCG